MLIAIVDSVENKINFTLHIISSHSSFRLILLCQVKPSRQRRRVLMVRVIIECCNVEFQGRYSELRSAAAALWSCT